MSQLLLLLALSGQSPDQGFYTPFSPQETLNVDLVATWSDGDSVNTGYSVTERAGYVYLALGGGGLAILDARYPEDSGITEVMILETLRCYSVLRDDTLLYAMFSQFGMTVYDISDARNPVILGHEKGPPDLPKQYPIGYMCKWDTLIAITYADWYPIYIYNVADLTKPVRISEWRPTWNSGVYQVAFYPPCYLYCSSNRGVGGYNVLYILDVSDPANPVVADSLMAPFGISMAVEIYDHYLYCGASAVSVWDISDPLNPIFLDGYGLYDRAEDFFINPATRRLYVVNHLYVFDISDPGFLNRVGEWHDTEYWCFSVFYDNGYIYTAGRGAVDHSIDLYILRYKYDTIIPPDTGDTSERYLDWMRTVYGNPGLEFSLNRKAMVSFSLFNAAGLKAYDKELGLLEPGPHTITLPALRPGVYFLNLKANEESFKTKVVFTRGG